ncbi:hypothetical protein [Paraconexibacter sp.]|uniref:hypothetical protein n=1 Tax=Paraconexibacter sp. TaxID=2949640 RepID=UPI00356B4F12
MRRRLPVVLVVLASALIGGCGGTSDADRVRAYFDDVDDVYQSAGPQFRTANDTYKKFSEGTLKGSSAEFELRRAELGIEDARQRIATLEPPVPARRLHTLVLRAYQLNVLMAAETRQLAFFVPRAERIVTRLNSARRELRKDLGVSGGLERQTRALRAYARRVGGLRDELTRLRPPPALAAAKETQLRLLTNTRSLTLRLIRAIAAQDKPAITSLLDRFSAAGDPEPDRARWQTGAIRAYRQRIVEIDRASAAATAERARVVRAVS